MCAARIPYIDWRSSSTGEQSDGATARRIWADGWREWTVITRDALAEGESLGPETIIKQEDATVVIPLGWSGRVGAAGALVLERGAV